MRPPLLTLPLAVAAVLLLGTSHPAPNARAADPNAPPESQLASPPDADKDVPSPPGGYVRVDNPAFPGAKAAPAPDRGRRFELNDVAPYFAEGALKEAKELFDRGLYEQARARLAGQGDSLPVRYLRTLSAARAGDAETAAAEFTLLAGAQPGEGYVVLRDRLLVHAALANEDLERWEEAARLYALVPAGSKLYADARFGIFRAARRLNRLDAAADALAPLASGSAPMWGRDIAAEALLALADLARDRKDRAGERDALLRLWSRHPLSGMAAHAERRLKGKIPVEFVVARAEQLVDSHRNEQGMAALDPHLPKLVLPDPLACRAHFTYGKALRKQRSHTLAIGRLQPVVDGCQDPDLRARALYVLGSSRSIVDAEHGPGTYELLARDYPAHSFADDALFFAADLYLRNGDATSALARLADIAERYPDGDFLGEALFKSFWILRGQGKGPEALATLDRIERMFATAKESYEVERAGYWRARMLLDAGQKDEAVRRFERLAIAHPVTYYGLMSRTRIEELAPERAPAVVKAITAPVEGVSPWPLHGGAVSGDSHLLAGLELIRLGFGEAASAELLAVNRSRLPPEPLQLLVHALALAGDAKSAHAIARTELRDQLSGPIRAETLPVWQVAYPDAFRELIERHSHTAQLDPDLLQALMREESALDPKALSWAGALGLTQLMLSTAKAVARDVPGLQKVTPQLLLQPDPNIRLGATHLGSLVRRFDGNKAFAVASYNAGSGAVVRWREQRSSLQLDEWVEEIPISETRGYVKRVLRTYNTYQLLYGRGIASVTPASGRGGAGGLAP